MTNDKTVEEFRVSQERLDAAVRRIEAVARELRRWNPTEGQQTSGTFGSEVAMLEDALALLDPKVSLA